MPNPCRLTSFNYILKQRNNGSAESTCRGCINQVYRKLSLFFLLSGNLHCYNIQSDYHCGILSHFVRSNWFNCLLIDSLRWWSKVAWANISWDTPSSWCMEDITHLLAILHFDSILSSVKKNWPSMIDLWRSSSLKMIYHCASESSTDLSVHCFCHFIVRDQWNLPTMSWVSQVYWYKFYCMESAKAICGRTLGPGLIFLKATGGLDSWGSAQV